MSSPSTASPHAVALLCDDEARTYALYRFLQQQAAFVSQVRLLVDYYMPALHSSVLSPPDTGIGGGGGSSGNVKSSLLPSIRQHVANLLPLSSGAARPAAPSVPAPAPVATPVSSDVSAVDAALLAELCAASPAAQIATLFGNVTDVQRAAEKFQAELSAAFVVVSEKADKPLAIYRSRYADTSANVDKGNVAVAAALFVDAMTDYLSAPFEAYCRNVHRAELTLGALLKNERFAAKVAAVRAALHGTSPSLNELLLAPLRQLSVYSRSLGALLEATPTSDWRERRRLTASLELANPRLDEIMALVQASASRDALLQIERRLVEHPLGKLALPGRLLVLSATVEVSKKTPPKWKERFLILFNDLLVWCQLRGATLVYDAHLELCDTMMYQTMSQGRPVVLQNNTVVQVVNKRERRLCVYSFRCATIHARRRLQTALSQRINAHMASVRQQHEEEVERERLLREQAAAVAEAKSAAVAPSVAQATAAAEVEARRSLSVERMATQFLAESETTLRECTSKFCAVETSFQSLQSQLDEFAEERIAIASKLAAIEQQFAKSEAMT
jgi:hypothetical protein